MSSALRPGRPASSARPASVSRNKLRRKLNRQGNQTGSLKPCQIRLSPCTQQLSAMAASSSAAAIFSRRGKAPAKNSTASAAANTPQ